VSPGHKRKVAERFVEERRCSQRQACRYIRLHRSTMRYEALEPDAWMMPPPGGGTACFGRT
jgi:hypothetical protein